MHAAIRAWQIPCSRGGLHQYPHHINTLVVHRRHPRMFFHKWLEVTWWKGPLVRTYHARCTTRGSGSYFGSCLNVHKGI